MLRLLWLDYLMGKTPPMLNDRPAQHSVSIERLRKEEVARSIRSVGIAVKHAIGLGASLKAIRHAVWAAIGLDDESIAS
jgi:hypothetical protein